MTQLRRASVDLHRSKSLPALTWDDFYIGALYEATGPMGRSEQRRRGGRCEGATRRAMCGESALQRTGYHHTSAGTGPVLGPH